MPSRVLVLDSVSQYQTLISHNRAVVVDCSAKWCGPCKQIAPKYDEMSSEYESIVFTKIDVDDAEELAQLLQVESMPTFIFVKNGDIFSRFSGANIKELRRHLDGINN